MEYCMEFTGPKGWMATSFQWDHGHDHGRERTKQYGLYVFLYGVISSSSDENVEERFLFYFHTARSGDIGKQNTR